MEQSTALRILQSGKNVFLTGAAGAGKTYVLNQYIRQLRRHGVPVAITASTGIAATHLGGQTIHSWAGMGIKDSFTTGDMERIARKKPVRERVEKAQVLVVDEISMLSKKMLANLDLVLQYVRLDRRPFGGLQVVLCGDFFQLPPVSREPLPRAERFCFMAPVWVAAQLQICYLTSQHRQSADDLGDFLNEMRSGELSDSRIDQLQECIDRTAENTPEHPPTRLYTHNADVDRINAAALAGLTTRPLTYRAKAHGSKSLVTALTRSIMAPAELQLAVGAEVMFVKNNPEKGYHNGTLGTVTSLTEAGHPVVTTRDDCDIVVKPEEWRIIDTAGQPVASYIQLPLRLAWAITVHKSQGMTLEAAEMDLSRTFELGQGYVALSRVKDWAGLRLLGCNGTALQVDPLVRKADVRFQELAAEAAADSQARTEAQHDTAWEKRVKRMGGTLDPKLIAQYEAKLQAEVPTKKSKSGRPKSGPKSDTVSTYMLTKRLVEEEKSLLEMMKARGVTEGTILKHLRHLVESDPSLAIDYLRPDPKTYGEIIMGYALCPLSAEAAKDPTKLLPMRAVYEVLKEKYNYRQIALVGVYVLRDQMREAQAATTEKEKTADEAA